MGRIGASVVTGMGAATSTLITNVMVSSQLPGCYKAGPLGLQILMQSRSMTGDATQGHWWRSMPADPKQQPVGFIDLAAGFPTYLEPAGPAHQLGPADASAGPPDDSLPDQGIIPSLYSFVFPYQPSVGADINSNWVGGPGARGSFGQPKIPLLMTRPLQSSSNAPWDLAFKFTLGGTSGTSTTDLKNSTVVNAPTVSAVLATGMAYYHRQEGANNTGFFWSEAPNLLNPFWHATLVPIDQDEHGSTANALTPFTDPTNLSFPFSPAPGADAFNMLQATSGANLSQAASAYQALAATGFRGLQ
jgi:hypothetical protein